MNRKESYKLCRESKKNEASTFNSDYQRVMAAITTITFYGRVQSFLPPFILVNSPFSSSFLVSFSSLRPECCSTLARYRIAQTFTSRAALAQQMLRLVPAAAVASRSRERRRYRRCSSARMRVARQGLLTHARTRVALLFRLLQRNFLHYGDDGLF